MSRGHVQTIVIGGSQAGLAVGYHLRRRGLPFVIVDENKRVGDAWRNRWDTLRLFTPARYSGLPGMPFPGPTSAYPTKDETANCQFEPESRSVGSRQQAITSKRSAARRCCRPTMSSSQPAPITIPEFRPLPAGSTGQSSSSTPAITATAPNCEKGESSWWAQGIQVRRSPWTSPAITASGYRGRTQVKSLLAPEASPTACSHRSCGWRPRG